MKTAMTEKTGEVVLFKPDALSGMKENWVELLRNSAFPAPFLLPAWQMNCLKMMPRSKKTEIFSLREKNVFTGIAFLMEERYLHFRRVRFAGTGSVDYLGFACRRGSEEKFFREFFLHCSQKGGNFVFDLQQMPEGTPLEQITETAKQHGFYVRCFPQDVCPVLSLPDTVELYFKSLSQNQRKTLKRLGNKLNKNFRASFRRVETAEELEFALSHFFRLHRIRWMMRGLPGMMYAPKIRGFHRAACHALLDEGLLRFYWLTLNDEVAAALYGFAWNNVFYFYLSGFHPRHSSYGIGTLLFYECIQRAIEEGLTSFDFMRGQEEYKYRFGAKDTANTRMIFSRNESLFKPYTRFHVFWQEKADAIKNKFH